MINPEFTKELAHLINRFSLENCSNTPDYILAEYLTNCLEAYNKVNNYGNISNRAYINLEDEIGG